jgi:hypothetical protein
MSTYHARILDAETGSEAAYQFEGPADLMRRTSDEVVGIFFDEVEHEALRGHADWELNAALSNRDRHVVTAIGSLFPKKSAPPIPFLLMISDHNGSTAIDP